MANLKPRQDKRLGRIAENNPERAAKVADRMEKRTSRTERGKEVAKASSRAMAEEKLRAKAEAVKKMTEKGKTKRPDTPLAQSPIPLFLRSK